jgi:hypothetical protein
MAVRRSLHRVDLDAEPIAGLDSGATTESEAAAVRVISQAARRQQAAQTKDVCTAQAIANGTA